MLSPVPDDLKKPIEPFVPKDEHKKAYKTGRVMGKLAGLAVIKEYEASHDELTGFLNKAALKRSVQAKVETQRVKGRPSEFGLFFGDLTNFKKANDVLGHERVDKLLKDFCGNLSGSLRDSEHGGKDVIAHERFINEEESELGRYGGDELAGIIDLEPKTETGQNMTPEQRLNVVANRIRNIFHEFINSQEETVKNLGLDIAIGQCVWQPGMTMQEMFQRADTDMFEQKKAQHDQLGAYRKVS